MRHVASLIHAVEREIGRPIIAAHQAGALAAKLLRLRDGVEPEHFKRICREFHARVRSAGLDDVLQRELTYATRLASAPGQLAYEELHKLLALCDEVYSLQLLGFSAPDALRVDFESSVRSRFEQQREAARMAAKDRVEEWKKGWWWYATLLA